MTAGRKDADEPATTTLSPTHTNSDNTSSSSLSLHSRRDAPDSHEPKSTLPNRLSPLVTIAQHSNHRPHNQFAYTHHHHIIIIIDTSKQDIPAHSYNYISILHLDAFTTEKKKELHIT
jgi:hypothetical protein